MADSAQVAVVRRLYEARGDPDVIRQVLSPDVRWEVVEGFPHGAVYVGLDDVLRNFFGRLFQVFESFVWLTFARRGRSTCALSDMASRTKKPHFVPAAYLQFWDSTGTPQGRESKVWWCDGKQCLLQRIGNVAVQAGLYSTKNPIEAEAYFGEFEVDWAKLVTQLLSGRVPRAEILASLLLLQSSYFLLRNPKFRKNDPAERIDVYKLAVEGFWREVLMAGHVPKNIADAQAKLLRTWSCHLLRAQKESWITSDNPVLLLTIGKTTPAIMFLPITPDWAVLALRAEAAKLSSGKITAQDTEYLNSYATINSIRHVFSKSKLSDGEIASVGKWIHRRPKTDNWISGEQIHVEPFRYPVLGMTLGFL
ncbi:MAG TPA: DUF4238 domain-containing protein [Candidatus Tectomicrobia bacterium]|nr:DUF4238 domain-containing protein [Candidatus Tectomicrobia bacterium]